MEFYIFSICVHDILSSQWGSLRRAGLWPLHQVFTHTDKALPTLFFSRLKVPSVSPHTTDTPIPPCSSLSMSGTRDARTGPSTPNVWAEGKHHHLLQPPGDTAWPSPGSRWLFSPQGQAAGHHEVLQALLQSCFPSRSGPSPCWGYPSPGAASCISLRLLWQDFSSLLSPSEGQHNHLVQELLLWPLHHLQSCWGRAPSTGKDRVLLPASTPGVNHCVLLGFHPLITRYVNNVRLYWFNQLPFLNLGG